MEKLSIPSSLIVFESVKNPKSQPPFGLVHSYQPTVKQGDNKVIHEFVKLRKDVCYIFQILTQEQFPSQYIKFTLEVLREQDISLEVVRE